MRGRSIKNFRAVLRTDIRPLSVRLRWVVDFHKPFDQRFIGNLRRIKRDLDRFGMARGMGAHLFDVKKFGCAFAYTMDGSEVGELEFENFNAASAKIHIKGVSVHPGYAKGKMINAGRIATELVQMLPQDETPETTEGYEGFFHLTGIQGGCEKADVAFIIRDHNRLKFEQRKERMEEVVAVINAKYGDGVAMLEMNDQYYNMREKVEPMMYIIDIAKKAMEEAGVTPRIQAIRGGTDGA